MERKEIMDRVAEYFDIEDYEYDLDSYEWSSGCYIRNEWLSLARVVRLIEDILEELD